MVNIFPVRQPGRKRVKITQPPCQPVDFLQHFCCGWNSDLTRQGQWWSWSRTWVTGTEAGLFLGSKWSRLIGWVSVGIYTVLGMFMKFSICWCHLVGVKIWFILFDHWSMFPEFVYAICIMMYSIYIYFMFGSSVSIEGWEVLHTWKGR